MHSGAESKEDDAVCVVLSDSTDSPFKASTWPASTYWSVLSRVMVFCIMPLLSWKHEIALLQSSFRERKWEKKKSVWVCVSVRERVGDGSWISLWIAEQKQVLQFHQSASATGGDERRVDRGALIQFGIDGAEVASEPVRRFKRRVSWGGIVTASLKDGALLGSRSVTPLP